MRNRSIFRMLPFHLPFERREGWPTPPDDLSIEGPRVRLRWPRMADASGVFAYARDDEVSRFMDWPPHRSIEESRRFLRSIERSRRYGMEAAFGVIDRETDRLVGICSLVRKDDPRLAELGYALNRSFWGRGYIPEAIRLIIEWAFPTLCLREIYAEVHRDNRPSQRVMEKTGFHRDPAYVSRSIKGVNQPHFRYRMVRRESALGETD